MQLIITKPSVAAALPLDGSTEGEHNAKRPAQGCTLPEVLPGQSSTGASFRPGWLCLRAPWRESCCVVLELTDQHVPS